MWPKKPFLFILKPPTTEIGSGKMDPPYVLCQFLVYEKPDKNGSAAFRKEAPSIRGAFTGGILNAC